MIVRGRFLCPKRVEDVNYVREIARDFYTEKKIEEIEMNVIETVATFKAFNAITTNQLMWILKENAKQIQKKKKECDHHE